MAFNATFNNISVISWWSVLLEEQVTDKVDHIMYHVHLAMNEVRTTTLVVIGTDCTDSCKSNYHMITTTTAPRVDCIAAHHLKVNKEIFCNCLRLMESVLPFLILPRQFFGTALHTGYHICGVKRARLDCGRSWVRASFKSKQRL